MGFALWVSKMLAKLAVVFIKLDMIGMFDLIQNIIGAIEEDGSENTDDAADVQ